MDGRADDHAGRRQKLGRQGASLLTTTGLADWVASDPAAYVARAVSAAAAAAAAAAADITSLAALRVGLRAGSRLRHSGPNPPSAVQGQTKARLQAWLQSPLLSYMQRAAPDGGDVARLLAELQQRGPLSVADILSATAEAQRGRVERGLVWLAKLGWVSVSAPAR